MLGWEFPPFIAGGLGVACYGLTRALDRKGHEITFVLPRPITPTMAASVESAHRSEQSKRVGQSKSAADSTSRPASLPPGMTVFAPGMSPGQGLKASSIAAVAGPSHATPIDDLQARDRALNEPERAPKLSASNSTPYPKSFVRDDAWTPPRLSNQSLHTSTDLTPASAASSLTSSSSQAQPTAELSKSMLTDPRGVPLIGFTHTTFLGVPTIIESPYGPTSSMGPTGEAAAKAAAAWLRPGASTSSNAAPLDPYASLAADVLTSHIPHSSATDATIAQLPAQHVPQAHASTSTQAHSHTRLAPLPTTEAGTYHSLDLVAETERYMQLVTNLMRRGEIDVIHAHDWLTYPAGAAAARQLGKPLVVHVHSTEFDRAGSGVNQRIFDIERAGMLAADKVIAVSQFTKSILVRRYGIKPAKIDVVYNGIERETSQPILGARIDNRDKIVLFLGRITMQKGPEYFIAAAKRVLSKMPDVKFVLAGSGDMSLKMIDLANSMGIGKQVLFTGFLKGPDVERVFQLADCYVMPSVSEPFGIAALEAISHDVPVILSKTSGASEVLRHVLKVDFWDIDDMANKILAVLRYPPLARTLREHGTMELRRLTWDDAACACERIYEGTRDHSAQAVESASEIAVESAMALPA